MRDSAQTPYFLWDERKGEFQFTDPRIRRCADTRGHQIAVHKVEFKDCFGRTFRRAMRISEIERLIRKFSLITPVPSRRYLIGLCEDGTLSCVPRNVSKSGSYYLVYVDSFEHWLSRLLGFDTVL